MLACRGDDGCDEWRNQITRERFWVKTYRKSVTIMFGSLLLCLLLGLIQKKACTAARTRQQGKAHRRRRTTSP
jgi:ABC-type Fe3+ transport system permease subunit